MIGVLTSFMLPFMGSLTQHIVRAYEAHKELEMPTKGLPVNATAAQMREYAMQRDPLLALMQLVEMVQKGEARIESFNISQNPGMSSEWTVEGRAVSAQREPPSVDFEMRVSNTAERWTKDPQPQRSGPPYPIQSTRPDSDYPPRGRDQIARAIEAQLAARGEADPLLLKAFREATEGAGKATDKLTSALRGLSGVVSGSNVSLPEWDDLSPARDLTGRVVVLTTLAGAEVPVPAYPLESFTKRAMAETFSSRATSAFMSSDTRDALMWAGLIDPNSSPLRMYSGAEVVVAPEDAVRAQPKRKATEPPKRQLILD